MKYRLIDTFVDMMESILSRVEEEAQNQMADARIGQHSRVVMASVSF
jgi:hypothetical protein